MRKMLVLSSAFLLAAQVAAAAPHLTLYSQDLGFVREPRTLEIGGARDTVRLTGIPTGIDISSVRLAPEGGARVARLAYRFDVATGDELLERSVGQRVRVTVKGDRVSEGALLAFDPSWLVVRPDDGAVVTLARAAVEEVRLAQPPRNLSLRPSLEAVLEGGKGKVGAELSYLTSGLSWSAEHTIVRQGETGATWSTMVQVENTTGVEYKDAILKLVAGNPRRGPAAPPPMPVMRTMAMTDQAEMKAGFAEEPFSEYHLYTLERPATLRDRERQSLGMIDPRKIQVTPRYLYRTGMSGVAAQMEIVNTDAKGLGLPLPGGRVRFFERDPQGDLQFTGETTIGHTAEGEKATLEMGTAFDLAAERRQVTDKRISDREREIEVEIKLRNRKKSDVTIQVEESVPGDWEILQKTHEFERKDANTLLFQVPVKAGQEVIVKYTARVRY
jgi:hypothetical protein